MSGGEIIAAVWLLTAGFWLGVLAEDRNQKRLNGNFINVGRWLTKAIVDVRDTHKFVGDLQCRNIGRLTTQKGETFSVTVERVSA